MAESRRFVARRFVARGGGARLKAIFAMLDLRPRLGRPTSAVTTD
ncbi:hypothetical protein [Anaeromyxobacter sp. Fw109-5]|nr:hypothetical protein [Anaeromyxobacter sp. Fw109-5]